MRAAVRHIFVWTVLAAALAVQSTPAAADAYDDIEERLKTTGVSASLAREITRTIRKGAKRLIEEQSPNGSWAKDPGRTALTALALVHTGASEARAAADKARGWLQRADNARRQVRLSTYESGIMAMLLHALAPKHRLLADLQGRLSRGATGFGYWGYLSAGESGMANLSTSQFACLGLWAAERAGLPRAHATWRLHADGLLRAQNADGGWGYWADERRTDVSYPVGTFMGLADLVLAQAPEIPKKRSDAERWYRIVWAQRCGQVSLVRHVRWVLSGTEGLRVGAGTYPYYALYAIEKASIFLDTPILGAIDWYERGAKVLVASQTDDGRFVPFGWEQDPAVQAQPFRSRTDTVSGAFALLFLLRASEVYRPVTPRGVPEPSPERVVTGEPEPPAEAPAADPDDEPARPPLAVAHLMLDQLEKKRRSLDLQKVPELQRLLEFVRRTLPRYTKDGKAIDTLHDAWVRRAEQLLVALCLPGAGADITDEPWRLVLAVDALDAMRYATARGGQLVKKSVQPRVYERHGQRRCGIAYYAALFRCLRATRVPELPRWLVTKCISSDAKQRVMTVPALLELGRVDVSDDAERRQLALALLRKMRDLEDGQSTPGLGRDLQYDVLLTVNALVGDADGAGLSSAGKSLAAWRRELSRRGR